MAALQCDMCGGKLIMDVNGQFATCESCGMQHNKERIQVKIQEIKGTVKVEGPVHVDGVSNAETLNKKAETLIQLDDKDGACTTYRKMTKEFPGDYRGWLGLAVLESEGFTKYKIYETIKTYWKNAKTVCNNDDVKAQEQSFLQFQAMYDEWQRKIKKKDSMFDEAERKTKQIEENDTKVETVNNIKSNLKSKIFGTFWSILFYIGSVYGTSRVFLATGERSSRAVCCGIVIVLLFCSVKNCKGIYKYSKALSLRKRIDAENTELKKQCVKLKESAEKLNEEIMS